jgi:hypothetical protein
VPAARVTAVVRARRLPGYLRAKRCIADEADKIEVRLLKAEQANWWRIVAATSLVTRPRIFHHRIPSARLRLRAATYHRVKWNNESLGWHGANDIRCDQVPDPKIEHRRPRGIRSRAN